MKILVTAKRVEDPESKIKVKPDGSGIVTEGVGYKINPFDEIAVEEALRLVAKHGGEVVALSIGSDKVQTELRHALALGADRGIWVKHEGPTDPDFIARTMKAIVAQENPDLILMGKQSIDDDQNQTGQMLAEMLGYPQATCASKVESLESDAEKSKTPAIAIEGTKVTVIREVDGGLETLEAEMPAVITADLRMNLPRYASLPNIMKAKKKPIAETTPEALGVATTLKVKVVKFSAPPSRKAGVMVADVSALVEKLRNEAKVL